MSSFEARMYVPGAEPGGEAIGEPWIEAGYKTYDEWFDARHADLFEAPAYPDRHIEPDEEPKTVVDDAIERHAAKSAANKLVIQEWRLCSLGLNTLAKRLKQGDVVHFDGDVLLRVWNIIDPVYGPDQIAA